MIKKANEKEAIRIYKEYITKDFKEAEIPEFEDYIKSLQNNATTLFCYYENDTMKAYILSSSKKENVLLLFFAVLKEYRSQGVGTRAIKDYKKEMKGKILLLEVEKEANAKNEKELETIKKRIRFYEKLGFKKVEEIEYSLKNVPYYVMVPEEINVKKEIIKNAIIEIYQNVDLNMNWIEIK